MLAAFAIALAGTQLPTPPGGGSDNPVGKACNVVVNLDDFIFKPGYNNGELTTLSVTVKGVDPNAAWAMYVLQEPYGELATISPAMVWRGGVENTTLASGLGSKLLRAADLYILKNSPYKVRNFWNTNGYSFSQYFSCVQFINEVAAESIYDGTPMWAFTIIP
ncbi:MAG: hypothetical protein Fur003_2930 [Candidatus Dojkabacteria bacterium]